MKLLLARCLVIIAALLVISDFAFADSQGSAIGGQAGNQSTGAGCIYQSPTLSAGQQATLSCDQNGNLKTTGGGGGGGSTTILPTNSSGAYSSVTIGTSASTVIAAAACKVFCDILNNSATATVCVNVGGTATAPTAGVCPAGEITLPPYWHRSWEADYVPSDAISAISSAASTPATVGAK